MKREKPAYRDNVEMLLEAYRDNVKMLLEANGRKTMIRISKAAKILGITRRNLEAALIADDVATVKVGESLMVSVPTLARWLS